MWANVGGIKAKLEAARGFGVGLFILPEETWALLERLGVEDEDAIATWDEELQAYARRVVRPAKTFADVIHAAVEGLSGQPPSDLAEALDGPHVGVGVCMTSAEDGTRFVEFQACVVGPGKAAVLMSGWLSEVTRQSVAVVQAVVLEHAAALDRLFTVGRKASTHPLARPHVDLHVHICNWWVPLEAPYQQAALYVALVSPVMRQRPRADTAIVGVVDNLADFYSLSHYTEAVIHACHRKGIRRLVCAQQTVLSPEAKAAAEEVLEDGRPRVEVLWPTSILAAVPMVFDLPSRPAAAAATRT